LRRESFVCPSGGFGTEMPMTTWTDRVWHEFRAGNLSRARRDVLLTLEHYRGCGEIRPSHAILAERAGCSVKTVQRALADAQALGLVDWAERRIWRDWRWLRTTNRYFLLMPGGPVIPTKGLRGRRSQSKKKKERIEVTPWVIEQAQAALKRVRERFSAAGTRP
jgi:hypothetical protein